MLAGGGVGSGRRPLPEPRAVEGPLAEIWYKTLTSVQGELPQPSFDMWLKGSRPLSIDGETMVIALRDPFARDWVEARYTSLVRRTLQSVSGSPLNVRWVSSQDSQDTRNSQDQEGRPQAEELPQSKTRPPKWSQAALRLQAPPKATSAQPSTSDEKAYPQVILNPKYTFDSFVVGGSNRFAHAASLAVAAGPERNYNPLFIYGGVGLGKTHLMQAIAHTGIELGRKRIVYVSCETFTNEMVDSIAHKSQLSFRQKYRTIDILLVDDIQFLAGREGTQEEFFHTFNALHEAGKQIVISSDRSPKDIPTLEERLRSRFEWGMTTDIQKPDLETRLAILRQKAAQDNISVPGEVLDYIANEVPSNIRELEGALNRVVGFTTMHNLELTLDSAVQALRAILSSQHRRTITIEDIQDGVSQAYKTTVVDLLSKKRTRTISFPRQIAMYLARELTDTSLPKIGEAFGGRDHTTVMHACERIAQQQQADPSFQSRIQDLTEQIRKA